MEDLTTTKTGIKIGSAYTPPPQVPSKEEELLQNILLDPEYFKIDKIIDYITIGVMLFFILIVAFVAVWRYL